VPLSASLLDGRCFRERIERERSHGKCVASPAVRAGPNTSIDKYKLLPAQDRKLLQGVAVQETSVAATLHFNREGMSSSSSHPFLTSGKPFNKFCQPIEPFKFDVRATPQRAQPHTEAEACTAMGLSTQWHGRPLIMSRGSVSENFITHTHSEPRGLFRSFVQQSTSSPAQGGMAIPVVPWKTGFTALLPSLEYARA
jgi:hypothetical protein